MKPNRKSVIAVVALVAGAAIGGCTRAPRTAQEIIARSVQAHGGDKLTNWQTLTVRGQAVVFDLVYYNATYTLQAKAPGSLLVEHNMLSGKGRSFREYFLDDGVAWGRSNLVVNKADLKQLQLWFGQCSLVARYARASSLTLKGEVPVEWQVRKPGAVGEYDTYETIETRPAYQISAVVNGDSADVFIDKETFYMTQEVIGATRLVYHNFKPFGGAVWPTEVLQVVKGGNRQTAVVHDLFTPFTYESVVYNEPIEDWLFTQDKPQTPATR